MDEKKQTEQEPETPADDKEDGDKSELAKETDAANAAAERMEKATEELNAAEARRRLGGTAEAGAQPKPKPAKLTDTEYAEALEKGEVNPLKEDGLI
jgi:hypothetical protein